MPCPTYIFLFWLRICRGFKKKSDVCYVLCEELFMLDVTHSQVEFETEFGVVSLILVFLYLLALKYHFLAFCKFLETAKD